jgi:hypothetical protein
MALRKEEPVLETDDLFLGAYGLVRGGELASVEVRGKNGRRVAVFQISGAAAEEAEREYHGGETTVDLRILKAEVRRLKDAVFTAIREEQRRGDAGYEGRDRSRQVREPAPGRRR